MARKKRLDNRRFFVFCPILLHGSSIYFIAQKIRTDIPLCRGKEVANSFPIVCKTSFDAPELHKRYPFIPDRKFLNGFGETFFKKFPQVRFPQK